jgi:catechol 2,3-dioxygenase-like lactoylglutathione lyase family enzyme
MIDHASSAVSDYNKSKEFYTKLLAPLGYTLLADMPEYHVAGYGDTDHADFWIGQHEHPKPGHTAFRAKNKGEVDAFHKAGLEAGGRDNGAPGYRKEYSPGYYGAFIHDLDGNNIEAVWHDPNPPQN